MRGRRQRASAGLSHSRGECEGEHGMAEGLVGGGNGRRETRGGVQARLMKGAIIISRRGVSTESLHFKRDERIDTLEKVLQVRERRCRHRQIVRAHAQIGTESGEHGRITSGQIVRRDIGITTRVSDLDKTPGRETRDKPRKLDGVKEQAMSCGNEGRPGRIMRENKCGSERIRLKDNVGRLIQQRS